MSVRVVAEDNPVSHIQVPDQVKWASSVGCSLWICFQTVVGDTINTGAVQSHIRSGNHVHSAIRYIKGKTFMQYICHSCNIGVPAFSGGINREYMGVVI